MSITYSLSSETSDVTYLNEVFINTSGTKGLHLIIGHGLWYWNVLDSLFVLFCDDEHKPIIYADSLYESYTDIDKYRLYLDRIIADIKREAFPLTILINYPEQGLHPHKLFSLLLYIRALSADHRVILTTNSPQVLDILEIDELDHLHLCVYEDNDTKLKALSQEQIAQATEWMENTGSLSGMWLHTNLLETINQ